MRRKGAERMGRPTLKEWGGYTMILDSINRVFISAMLAAKREEGQTFVEYALIGVLVAVALVAGLGIFKDAIGTALTNIGNAL
jgi:Flp pilus assembly pilin Flp